ncbi:MAG: bactofilin family protein [Candidatus Omnitrophota bacterium]
MALFKRNEHKSNDPAHSHPRLKAPSFSDARPSEIRKSVIGQTVFIKGNVFAEEEVLIEGKIEGKVNSKHLVVIGKNGVVNADIDAQEIIIKGVVNGNVRGSFKVEVVPEGVLNGNVISQRVVLAEGAIFKGNIDMSLKEEKG